VEEVFRVGRTMPWAVTGLGPMSRLWRVERGTPSFYEQMLVLGNDQTHSPCVRLGLTYADVGWYVSVERTGLCHSHGRADTFGRQKSSLDPYWK
jgi:hypothetical protein